MSYKGQCKVIKTLSTRVRYDHNLIIKYRAGSSNRKELNTDAERLVRNKYSDLSRISNLCHGNGYEVGVFWGGGIKNIKNSECSLSVHIYEYRSLHLDYV